MYQARSIIPAAKRFIWPHDKPPFGVKLNRRHPRANGLVGVWVMNERAGNKLVDLSEQGNDGVINGCDWCTDGLDFAASNSDYVDCGNNNVLDIPGEISIIAMVNPITGTDMSLVSKGSSGAYDFTYNPYILSTNKIAYIITQPASTYHRFITDGTPVTSGNWQQIGVVYNPSSSYYKIYHNGLSQAVTWDVGVAGTVPVSNSLPTEIGRRNLTGNYRYFNGLIAYVYIYNRALKPYEITSLHRDPYQMFQPAIDPAMMYYETPSGLTILDYERAIGRGICRGIGRGIA